MATKKTSANSACSDFSGSASFRSLQRTASASHSLNSHNPENSSTILEFASSIESEKCKNKKTSDSAEVSLDNFVGFQARNCEIEQEVHRAVECVESRESAKETIAQPPKEPKLRPLIVGANGLSLGISIVVAILLGIGAGILMQKIFGVFWVLFLGVAWGIAAAILNVYKVYKAELIDFEKLAEDPKYKHTK